MKITDIIKVRITDDAIVSSNGFTNREAVACIILQNSAVDLPTSATWLSYEQILALGDGIVDPAQKNAYNTKVKNEIEAWAATFTAHGGNILQAKFKQLNVSAVGVSVSDLISSAVYGSPLTTGLDTNIVQLQLLWERGGTAESLVDEATLKAISLTLLDQNYPINSKVLYVTRLDKPTTNISEHDNLVWVKTGRTSVQTMVYESALPMAFFASIDFNSTQEIKDVEYTQWAGASLDGATTEEIDDANGSYNIVTDIKLSGNANYRLFVRGEAASGIKIRTIYFEIIISQLCTDALARLVFEKKKFTASTFGLIYSTLANVLDKFTINQLLDIGFVSDITRIVNRNGVDYHVLKQGEKLPYGYKLGTLPVTRSDQANKIYTGTFLYIAFADQIRKIELNGLLIGGF